PKSGYRATDPSTRDSSRRTLDPPRRPTEAASASAIHAAPRAETIRPPAWTVPVAQSDEQAETAVLAVLDEPSRIALITNRKRLQVYSAEGKALGQAPEILGVGRIVRTAPGWIAAA